MAWFHFTFIIGRFPAVGIYILMVERVAKEVIKFLLLYSCAILAFAFSFHILLVNSSSFTDPLTSILGILAMMAGEFEFGTTFTIEQNFYNGVTQLLFVLFLLFITIIIMNLLIGLAISNINIIFMSAGVNRLKITVNQVQ